MRLRASTAVRRLLAATHREMTNRAAAILATHDEEALHQFRVAVRRFRVLLRTFRKPLADAGAEQVYRRLTALARAMGPARDADVLLSILQRPAVVKRVGEHPRWRPFLDAQRARQQRLRESACCRLEGRAWDQLCARMSEMLTTGWKPAARNLGTAPFEALAARRLHKAFHAALKRRRLAASRDPKKLHRLRIELRKTRHLGQCFTPALGWAARELTRMVHERERLLGRVHDLDIALLRVARARPAPPPELVAVLRRRRKKLLRRFRSLWPQLERPAFQRQVDRRLRLLYEDV